MAKLTLTSCIVLAVVGLHSTYGMDCTLGQSHNVVDQLINSCPRPLIDNESEKYCCWSPSGDNTVVRCCNLTDFTFNSISILLPFIIIGLIVSFIVSCICCLCCPCCCVYKRRSGGSDVQLQQLELQLQQQQLQIQQQQLLLQQQQLDLDRQRQQSQPQFPPPYAPSFDKQAIP